MFSLNDYNRAIHSDPKNTESLFNFNRFYTRLRKFEMVHFHIKYSVCVVKILCICLLVENYVHDNKIKNNDSKKFWLNILLIWSMIIS